jgi:hypothetical protein
MVLLRLRHHLAADPDSTPTAILVHGYVYLPLMVLLYAPHGSLFADLVEANFLTFGARSLRAAAMIADWS